MRKPILPPKVRVNDDEGKFLAVLGAKAQEVADFADLPDGLGAIALEIGSAYGYSAKAISHGFQGQIVCIDPWMLGEDPRYNNPKTFAAFLESTKGRAVIPIMAPAQFLWWWNTPLALLHIDGDHSFEAAARDYLMFAKHLVPGGILVLHDYEGPGQAAKNVKRVVEEIIRPSGLWDNEWSEYRFWCARRNSNAWRRGGPK